MTTPSSLAGPIYRRLPAFWEEGYGRSVQRPDPATWPIVADLAEAEQAISGGDRFLRSPPQGIAIHGLLWFLELQRQLKRAYPEVQPLLALDCGDRGDLAIEALRAGASILRFSGPPAVLAKIRDIARQSGAEVLAQD